MVWPTVQNPRNHSCLKKVNRISAACTFQHICTDIICIISGHLCANVKHDTSAQYICFPMGLPRFRRKPAMHVIDLSRSYKYIHIENLNSKSMQGRNKKPCQCHNARSQHLLNPHHVFLSLLVNVSQSREGVCELTVEQLTCPKQLIIYMYIHSIIHIYIKVHI